MHQITFYLLPEITIENCGKSLCQIVEKYYLISKTIFLFTHSETLAKQLNDLLWTFHDTSFLPHEIYDEKITPNTPILIGKYTAKAPQTDIFINLTPEAIESKNLDNKTEIIEIVPNDTDLKTKARQRYKFYKDNGFNIETINKCEIQK